VHERVALAEMYSELAQRTGDAKYAAEARQILEPLAKLDHADPIALVSLAQRLDQDGQIAQSVDLYRRCLQALPDVPASADSRVVVQNNLAMVLAKTGNTSEGQTCIDAALKVHPELPELYDTRSFVEVKAGATKAALSDIQRAVLMDPAEPRYRLRLIQMLADDNQPTEANRQLQRLLAMPFDRAKLSPEQSKQLKDLSEKVPAAAADGNGAAASARGT
jgi:Tfp pilus assembly protein PilF